MDPNNNDTNKKVKMFFFPFIAGGHLLPMIGMARSFASHPNVQVTIIATPKNVLLFKDAIDRDRELLGHDIRFHTIELPNKADLGGVENFLVPVPIPLKIKVFMAISNLKDTLKSILATYKPDCLVSDTMHPWSLAVANEVGIPRIVFHSTSLFGLCCEYNLYKFKPHENLRSDDEPFVLDGLPDKVEFTRKMLPHWHRSQNDYIDFFRDMKQADDNCYGTITNSYCGLENEYHNYAKKVMGKRVWMVGPVSNKHTNKIENTEDGENILKWLDSKEPTSVLYVSFGTEAPISKDQYHEISRGLKASGVSFIWAARTDTPRDQSDEEWFPDGFEEDMKKSNQGLVVKGWAPQAMILCHAKVGAFMTHCGWNSCLEGVANGIPMVTWPITADQFYNESLLVDVVQVAIRVGNKEQLEQAGLKATVTKDQVEEAIRRIMEGGEEVKGMRKRVQQYALQSKKAVLQGGSSYQDIDALIQELKARQK